jgi:hypothetical protein
MRVKTVILILLCWTGAVLLLGLGATAMCARYGVLSSEYDIDIMAGRVRSADYVAGIRVRNDVAETDMSRFYRELIGRPPAPVWRRVFGRTERAEGGGMTSDGAYRSIPLYLDGFAVVLSEDGLFTRDAKRAVIEKLFAMLRQEEPGQVLSYSDALDDLTEHWNLDEKGPIGVKDLLLLGPLGQEPE